MNTTPTKHTYETFVKDVMANMTPEQIAFRETLDETRSARKGAIKWHVLPSRRVTGFWDISFEKGANVARYFSLPFENRAEALDTATAYAFAEWK